MPQAISNPTSPLRPLVVNEGLIEGSLEVKTSGRLIKMNLTDPRDNPHITEEQRTKIENLFIHLLKDKHINLGSRRLQEISIKPNPDSTAMEVHVVFKKNHGPGVIEKVEVINDEDVRNLTDHSITFKIADNQRLAAVEAPTRLEAPEKSKSKVLEAIRSFIRKILNLLGFSPAQRREITNEIMQIVRQLPTKTQELLNAHLHSMTHEELYFLEYMVKNIDLTRLPDEFKNNPQLLMAEVLRGAYIQIEDGGTSYDDWCAHMPDKFLRLSSHESDSPQYAFRGPIVSEALFSRKAVAQPDGTKKIVTWFQLERYPAKFGYNMLHLWTWVLYKMSGKNQGPFGDSDHREKSNPITLYLKPRTQAV